MLGLTQAFSFLDRQIMSTLAEPIRIDLMLSDTQLGMLTGLGFALFYTIFGIPVAWLADRFQRVWIIAVACSLWSLFTASSGLAASFWQLAAARVGVGVGDAGGAAPSYSLIADYFPPERRGRALALYSAGLPVGAMIGLAAGGWIAAAYGWRMAFFAVGFPGLLLGPLLLLVVEERKRGIMDELPGRGERFASPSLLVTIIGFFRNWTLTLIAMSSGLAAFVGYGVLNWVPVFLMRVKHMSLVDVALYYSLLVGVSGLVGIIASGWLVDHLARKNGRWYTLLPAIAFALEVPFFAGFIFAPSWPWALALLPIPLIANTVYLAPTLALLQNTVPPAQRAVSSAILLFILNLIGLGGGPLFVGLISDQFVQSLGERSLVIGLAAMLPIISLTAVAYYIASRSIKYPAAGEGGR